jgi:3-oxoacyl-[acyl-carrier protein] reductase
VNILQGKVAIVTGAGKGVGAGHCKQLIEQGAKVVVNDLNRESALSVVEALRQAGGDVLSSHHDISQRAGCEALVERAIKTFGRIDILINNAGIVRDRTLLKMTDEEFELVWKVHVMGTFWCSQAAARAMVKQGQGGVIINTTSAAHFGSFGQTNYAAAKGAIASMTYTWAMELASKGIRVNAISPLATTDMSDTYKNAGDMPYFDPAANGPFVCWLASDSADYVSGQVFGTGGERIALLQHPGYGKTATRQDGWDMASIDDHFPLLFRGQFGPLGMLEQPYPFNDGVKSNFKSDSIDSE